MPGPGRDLIGEEEIATGGRRPPQRLSLPLRSRRRPPLQGLRPPARRPRRGVDGGPLRAGHQLGHGFALARRWSLSASGRATRSSCPDSRSSPASRRSSSHRATPVLAEMDATLNLDPADVEAKITPRTQGDHGRAHAGQPSPHRRAQGDRRPARDRAHRGLRTGVRRQLRRPQVGSFGTIGGIQLQRVQDHHRRATAAWS